MTRFQAYALAIGIVLIGVAIGQLWQAAGLPGPRFIAGTQQVVEAGQ